MVQNKQPNLSDVWSLNGSGASFDQILTVSDGTDGIYLNGRPTTAFNELRIEIENNKIDPNEVRTIFLKHNRLDILPQGISIWRETLQYLFLDFNNLTSLSNEI